LVAIVWGILWCQQLYEKQEISKASAMSVMKEPSNVVGRGGVGNISTIMQETVGDDTIMEETAEEEENSVAVMMTTTTEQDGSKTLAETADMA
jgi:hypothetical protein